MLVHEYQAKQIFLSYGIQCPEGILIDENNTYEKISKKINEGDWVVKAQIHAGGRGKTGGVLVCNNNDDIKNSIQSLLNKNLVTNQTSEKGLVVNKILLEKSQNIKKQLYLSFIINRNEAKVMILAYENGGVNIEEHGKEVKQFLIEPLINIEDAISYEISEKIANYLKINHLKKELRELLLKLYKIWLDKDLLMLEINPLIIDDNDNLIALDAKLEFDDNALYRRPDIMLLRDLSQENKKEIFAKNNNFSYVQFDGNIGCIVNGAGLAMATLDIIKNNNGNPANFLDVGGATNEKRVEDAFSLLQSDNIKVIFINIFGGIVRCDTIANGIVLALEKKPINIPLVIRLVGNNAKLGLNILANTKQKIYVIEDLVTAARKAIELANL